MSGLRLSSSVLRRRAAKWPRSNGRIITDYCDYTELLLHTGRGGEQDTRNRGCNVLCDMYFLGTSVTRPPYPLCVRVMLFIYSPYFFTPKYFTKCNNENWETEDVFIG